MAAIHRLPPAARTGHKATPSAFDHALSARLDTVQVQLDDPSTGRMQRIVLKIRKRFLERHVPAYGAKAVQR